MQTLEQRRAAEKERHRKSMARKRAEDKATLLARREECAALIVQQRPLLAVSWYQRECEKLEVLSPWSVFGGPTDSDDAVFKPATKLSLLHDKYTDLVELGNAIHRENAELQQALNKYEVFESLVDGDLTRVASDQHKTQQQSEAPSSQRTNSGGCWVQFTEDEDPFYYEAVDASACHDAVVECYPLCVSHHTRFMQLEQPQQFFGWNVQRLADRGRKLPPLPLLQADPVRRRSVDDRVRRRRGVASLQHARAVRAAAQRSSGDACAPVHG